ncbi:MAG: hypothetical protein DI551_03650 [Micavibrio aeruginosavorus]|uniref:Uncharacterized protein n=1 Tax=Micavibrio aeruginosavorus TaxID=349221 RepID=A0A2W5N2D0_9BACT|nr:MAG: hypothetical protein DI551_03650 [Micavibrio aeruginosavorus]
MGLNYTQLNESVRRFMLLEFDQGGHYISPRLNEAGRARWLPLLRDALQYHTDLWLERELIRRNCFLAAEMFKSPMGGKTITRAINKEQSAKALAEGEFNRFYLRGLCLAAKARDYSHVIVTQGKVLPGITNLAQKSVGSALSVEPLLESLRNNSYKRTDLALGAPENLTTAAFLSARLPAPGEAYALSRQSAPTS